MDLGYGGGFGGEGGVDDDHEEIERAVSEYLVYRGFTQTCYSLYEEKRVDLSHEMQSERILSDFVGCIWFVFGHNSSDFFFFFLFIIIAIIMTFSFLFFSFLFFSFLFFSFLFFSFLFFSFLFFSFLSFLYL